MAVTWFWRHDFLHWLSQVPVQSFSGKEHSRRATALVDDIELESFTDVAIDERTDSKATKSKIKKEVEHSGSLSALADNVGLDNFTNVAIDERTDSKATKSKIKTEIE